MSVIAACLVLVVSGCSTASDSSTTTSTTTSPPASVSPSVPSSPPSGGRPSGGLPPATQVYDIEGIRTYDARPNADWVVVSGGTAWVANVGHGVARYDAHTGRPLGSVGPGLDICTAMESGFGSLWAVDCPSRRLFRFDLGTGKQLAAVQLPFAGIQEEGSLAAGDNGVYVVASGGSEIARVDPATNQVVDRLPGPKGAAGIRFGFGSLWVTSPTGRTVTRLDPRDGNSLATVKVGSGAYFLDVGANAVWVMNNATSDVRRIDPRTNTVTDTIDVSDTPVDGGDLTVGGGSVWARVTDVLVVRIDPATRRVVDRIGDAFGSGSADADREAVWISAHDRFVVYRVPID